MFLGDADGTVHLIDKQLILSSFRAYETTLTHIIQVPQTTFLVTAGSDEAAINPVIRLYNLEKWSSHPDGRKPVCMREIRCTASVSCMAAAESLSILAVGFADGTLVIHKGDVSRERQSKHMLVNVSNSPITGIEFGCVNWGPHQDTTIFVATSQQIFSFTIRKDRETRRVLDAGSGAQSMCSCLINDQRRKEKLFVVGRKDAVYFYQSDERGPCFAFEGEKDILMPFRDYLIVVGKEKASETSFSLSSPSFESERSLDQTAGLSTPSAIFGDYNHISIYDLQNKFVAYTSPIPPVQAMVSEWGMLYILAKDGRMFQLSEKDISSKLEVLFRKNQFSLASELAQNYNYGADQLAEISKRYADHLYKNGDYETAITQYCKTIGIVEPSYVIRKFLDSSRIQNLTFYLQQLISKKLGNEDHTTLLINCFAKLKDDAELSKLTAQASEFDVDTAVKVLRRAGFYDHAAQLAATHSKYDAYFQIQLKERNDVSTALQFLLQNVPEGEQLAILIKYGRILIAKEPQRTTDLAKKITCRYLEDSSCFSLSLSDSADALSPVFANFGIDDLLNIFVQNTDAMINFIEYLIEKQPSKTTPSFYNTILGLLMRSFNSSGMKKQEISDKIMRILQNGDANYDMDQALLLCAANSFDQGLLYLYRKSKSYRLLQQHFIRKRDADNVVECCREYGAADPQLWVEAVYFFRENQPTSERQVATVVAEIEKLHLMQPMTVIETLCLNERLPLACIRDYMVRFLTAESEMIAENDKMILQDKDETERMKQAIDDLKTSPRTFQAAKCSGCSKSLDVPSVHFYCGHSYHQSCFESYSAEHDSECPICLPENTKLLNLIQYRKSVKDLSQKLRQQLGRADSDAMTVVSSFLSKGVFGSAEN